MAPFFANIHSQGSLVTESVELRNDPAVLNFALTDPDLKLRRIHRGIAKADMADERKQSIIIDRGMRPDHVMARVQREDESRDDPAKLEAAFREAAQNADAIVTTGGVSVGEADFVKPMMAKLGEALFWRIAMRPGRPMAFGRIGEAFLFGLPGNPVAVMVTFYQFVREALLVLGGRAGDCAPLGLEARAAEPMRKVPGRTEYQRGILFREDGALKVKTTGQQGSGVLRSMSEANCFIVLEHERGSVKAGEPVSVQLFEGLA